MTKHAQNVCLELANLELFHLARFDFLRIWKICIEFFIFLRFRTSVVTVVDGRHEIAQPVYDAEGRGSVEHVGERKTAVAKVKVTKPGSGEFVIRHVDYMDVENDITYFFEYVSIVQSYILLFNS